IVASVHASPSVAMASVRHKANKGASSPPIVHAANDAEPASNAPTTTAPQGLSSGANTFLRRATAYSVASAQAAPSAWAHPLSDPPNAPSSATSKTHNGLVKPSTRSPGL